MKFRRKSSRPFRWRHQNGQDCSATEREVDDVALTRYACYLIAKNADPTKPEVACTDIFCCSGEKTGIILHPSFIEFSSHLGETLQGPVYLLIYSEIEL